MKNLLKTVGVLLFFSLFLYSCTPVRQTSHQTPKAEDRPTRQENNVSTTKPKPREERNTTNNDIYVESMKFLKSYASDMTDYCVTWVGTPHRMGGTTRDGVDCSGFVCNVYQDVYGIKLPRNSGKMEQECVLHSNKKQLKEGDLIFFGKNNVNHVAIFIKDDKFVHTSSSKGVIVSSLEEKYWKENYRSCGRPKK